jgi:hypothetical protein
MGSVVPMGRQGTPSILEWLFLSLMPIILARCKTIRAFVIFSRSALRDRSDALVMMLSIVAASSTPADVRS